MNLLFTGWACPRDLSLYHFIFYVEREKLYRVACDARVIYEGTSEQLSAKEPRYAALCSICSKIAAGGYLCLENYLSNLERAYLSQDGRSQ